MGVSSSVFDAHKKFPFSQFCKQMSSLGCYRILECTESSWQQWSWSYHVVSQRMVSFKMSFFQPQDFSCSWEHAKQKARNQEGLFICFCFNFIFMQREIFLQGLCYTHMFQHRQPALQSVGTDLVTYKALTTFQFHFFIGYSPNKLVYANVRERLPCLGLNFPLKYSGLNLSGAGFSALEEPLGLSLFFLTFMYVSSIRSHISNAAWRVCNGCWLLSFEC